MAMQCNIDAKGKLVRAVYGLIMFVIAGVLAGLLLFEVLSAAWLWAVVAVLGVMGLFGLFEARKGWCAVRAMGFKTPY